MSDCKTINKKLTKLTLKPKTMANKMAMAACINSLKEAQAGQRLTYGQFCAMGSYRQHFSRNTFNRYVLIGKYASIFGDQVYIEKFSEIENFIEKFQDMEDSHIEEAVRVASIEHGTPTIRVVSEILNGRAFNPNVDCLIDYTERCLLGASHCIIPNAKATNRFIVSLDTEFCSHIAVKNKSTLDDEANLKTFLSDFITLYIFLTEISGVLCFKETYKACVDNKLPPYMDLDANNLFEIIPINEKPERQSPKIIVNLWRQFFTILANAMPQKDEILPLADLSEEQIISNYFHTTNGIRTQPEMLSIARRFK